MNSSDFDSLSQIWTEGALGQRPDELAALSDRALRRARLAERVELAITFVLVAGIVVSIAWQGHSSAMLVGTGVIALLLWSSYSRYRLRRVEWLADGSDREAFLQGAMRRTRARLRRAVLGLLLLPPAAILGTLFAHAASGRQGMDSLIARLSDGLTPGGPTTLGIVALLGIAVVLFVTIRQERRQLDRLTESFESYRREALPESETPPARA